MSSLKEDIDLIGYLAYGGEIYNTICEGENISTYLDNDAQRCFCMNSLHRIRGKNKDSEGRKQCLLCAIRNKGMFFLR